MAAAELCQLVDLDQRDTRRAIGNWLGFRGITAIIATVLVRDVISIAKVVSVKFCKKGIVGMWLDETKRFMRRVKGGGEASSLSWVSGMS